MSGKAWERLLQKQQIILDGGMGTMLQAAGLKSGELPELFTVTQPKQLLEIHRAYVEAGAELIYTNTFGCNRLKLRNTDYDVPTLCRAAVALAKEACAGTSACVALDIGPLGQLLAPLGSLSFDEAYELFREQIAAVTEPAAGERESAAIPDCIVIETMSDLAELKAALLAAKETCSLPVLCSMTFERNGRTFTGVPAAAFALTAQGLGAAAIGINCSLGPLELKELVAELREVTRLPLLLKPNAGLPDPESGRFSVSPEAFAAEMAVYFDSDVRFFGGCCGTTPAHIRAMRERLTEAAQESNGVQTVAARTQGGESNGVQTLAAGMQGGASDGTQTFVAVPAVCSATRVVRIDRPRIIGERLNPTGKRALREALQNENMDYLLRQALEQTEAGAEILDVNVGVPGLDEKRLLCRVVRELQAITDAPLQLDSTQPEVLDAALRAYVGKPIVNSVNGEEASLAAILPLVKHYGAAVVGLTLDENGIPKTADGRFEIAKRILDRALAYGIPREDVLIDCLTLTASAEQAGIAQTLEAVRRVKQELGLRTVLGVSNCSFGLPNRELVNRSFLLMALTNGLDLPIINPNLSAMTDTVRSYLLLANYDENALGFIEAYKDFGKAEAARAEQAGAKRGQGATTATNAQGAANETGGQGTTTVTNAQGAANETGRQSAVAAANGQGTANETGGQSAVAATNAQGAANKTGGQGAVATTNAQNNAAAPYAELCEAICEGRKERAAELTAVGLKEAEPMVLIEAALIPALDRVGAEFEAGRCYLPQLLMAAGAAQSAFACIRAALSAQGQTQEEKGKIVLATVKGDIHDIGKNIVKVMLENYGYTVIDLGKDVPCEAVLEAVKTHQAPLVGLSALMTTTLHAMEETIVLLRADCPNCKIMVGGAVLTPEYAHTIGADYYCRDAKESVDTAKLVFGA